MARAVKVDFFWQPKKLVQMSHPTYASAVDMFPPLPSALPEAWRTVSKKSPSPSSSETSSTSSSSSAFGHNEFDPKKFIDNLYTKLNPVDGEKGLHDMLSALYRAKPECFIINGNIHNSADGKDTYLSIRIYTSNTFWHNVHIYGIMRGNCFRVLRTETYLTCDDKQKKYLANFNRLETVVRPTSMNIW